MKHSTVTGFLSAAMLAGFAIDAGAADFEYVGEATDATGALAALVPAGTAVGGPIGYDDAAVSAGLAGPGDVDTIDVNVGGFCFTTNFTIDPDTGDPVGDPANCPLGGAAVPITSIDAAAITFDTGLGIPTGGSLDVTAFSPTFGVLIPIAFDLSNCMFFADGDALGTVSGIFAWADDADCDQAPSFFDNCVDVFNPGQEDSNGDDIGNICDADITGPGAVEDCFVNFQDLQAVKTAFFSNPASPNWNPNADLDSSGLINFSDLQIVKAQFFGPPGPSAFGCN